MSYAFCPKCSHPLENRFIDGQLRLVCTHCNFIFFQNSKPCASVLLLNEGRLLLVKRAIEPYRDWWDIPGGFLEAGEHPEEGAAREMLEETGLQVKPVELLGIFMDTYGSTGDHTLNLCYVAALKGGTPRPASDAAELAWFDLRHLPEQVAFDWSAAALALLHQKYGVEPGAVEKL
jgi:ADP-ribose pyrophosphatase YjhB (NUDIX family)